MDTEEVPLPVEDCVSVPDTVAEGEPVLLLEWLLTPVADSLLV